MPGTQQDPTRDLLRTAEILAAQGLLPATDGNFSVCLDTHRVLLTASGVEKRQLSASDLVVVNLNDEQPAGASSEWRMHRSLYQARPEVGAVLHVHAPFLTTFAVAHKLPNQELLAEAYLTLGGIALVPYCRPGTQDVGDALLRSDPRAGIYLLANHGAVAVGKDLREALHRLERAEFLARVEWQAQALGGPVPIPRRLLADLC